MWADWSAIGTDVRSLRVSSLRTRSVMKEGRVEAFSNSKVIPLFLKQESGMGHGFLDQILPEPDMGINDHGRSVQIGKEREGHFSRGCPLGRLKYSDSLPKGKEMSAVSVGVKGRMMT